MNASTLLTPVSGLYGLAVHLKNSMYSRDYLNTVELRVPVLSIGNITMGGTGKTPVVEAFLAAAEKTGDRIAVISRNYKANCPGAEKVGERSDGAYYYGDEPYWLWRQHPGMDVFVGPSKSEVAKNLIPEGGKAYSLVIVDDGFQHRRLKRNFDIVLIDAAAGLKDYRLLPVGRGREPVSSVFDRAQHVLLTKCNWASRTNLEYWRKTLEGRLSYSELNYGFHRIRNLETFEELELVESGQESVVAFCGLAQPESFAANLRKYFGGGVALEVFGDHHKYSEDDVNRLLNRSNTGKLITTEKDAIKLLSLQVDHSRIWVTQLEVSPTDWVGSLYEKAKRSFG